MVRLLFASAAVLLLLSGATAQSTLGTVEADAVSGSGVVTMESGLLAYWPGRAQTPDDVVAWTLETPSVEATRETVERTVYASGTDHRTDQEVDSTTDTLQDATIRASKTHDGVYIFVSAIDATVAAQGTDLTVHPLTEGEVREPLKYEDQQPPLSASWDQALDVSAQQASITIEGAFVVGVWGATLAVDHSGGSESWPSGRYYEQRIDPDGNVMVADEAWIYLEVREGSLTIPAQEIPSGSLIAGQQASLDVAGALQARGAQGQLSGYVLEGVDVTVAGSLTATDITARDSHLSFAVEGTPDALILGGQRVMIDQGDGPSWLWGLVAVPVLAAWLVRRQRPEQRMERIRTALSRGRYGSVVRRAPNFFGTTLDGPARIATSVALLRTERPEQVLEVLSQGDAPHGTACMLRAHALALLGNEMDARSVLWEALDDSPHLRPEAERNPVLARLLSDRPSPGGYA